MGQIAVKEAGPLGNLILSRESPLPTAKSRTIQIETTGRCRDATAEFDKVAQTFNNKGKSISFSGMRKPGMHRYRLTGIFTEKPMNKKLQIPVRMARKSFFLYQPCPMRHPLRPQCGHTSARGTLLAFPRAA